MRWLLFLSRVAFICNVFFLLTFSLHFHQWISDESLVSTIIVLGYFLAVFLFTPVVNLCYLALYISGRNPVRHVPQWLIVSNMLFLVLQLIYIILNNGAYNN